MALATRCPKCGSMFRVVSDQLKLRGGLVRCGACRHVFDAIATLSYLDEAPLAAAPAPPVGSAQPLVQSGERATTERAPSARVSARQPEPPRHASDGGGPPGGAAIARRSERVETLAVPTLFVPNVADEAGNGPADEARAAARTAGPATRPEAVGTGSSTDSDGEDQPADEPSEAPAFLRESAQRSGFSLVFGGGSLVLALLLLAQLVVAFRTDLVTRWPDLKPRLTDLCSVFGCTVGWPTRADLLAVIGSELQAVPGTDLLELTAVIRNRAGFRLALPAVEVTLTDTQNRTLARKVFPPADYLASMGETSSRIDDGLAAGSDLVVRIVFEARGLNASGFVVYPFYL